MFVHESSVESILSLELTLKSASDISIAAPRTSNGILIAFDAPKAFKLPSRVHSS